MLCDASVCAPLQMLASRVVDEGVLPPMLTVSWALASVLSFRSSVVRKKRSRMLVFGALHRKMSRVIPVSRQ